LSSTPTAIFHRPVGFSRVDDLVHQQPPNTPTNTSSSSKFLFLLFGVSPAWSGLPKPEGRQSHREIRITESRKIGHWLKKQKKKNNNETGRGNEERNLISALDESVNRRLADTIDRASSSIKHRRSNQWSRIDDRLIDRSIDRFA